MGGRARRGSSGRGGPIHPRGGAGSPPSDSAREGAGAGAGARLMCVTSTPSPRARMVASRSRRDVTPPSARGVPTAASRNFTSPGRTRSAAGGSAGWVERSDQAHRRRKQRGVYGSSDARESWGSARAAHVCAPTTPTTRLGSAPGPGSGPSPRARPSRGGRTPPTTEASREVRHERARIANRGSRIADARSPDGSRE